MNPVLRFVEEVKSNNELLNTVLVSNSVEEMVSLGEKHGFTFTAQEFFAEADGLGELKNDSLVQLFGSNLEEIATGFATCPCTWED